MQLMCEGFFEYVRIRYAVASQPATLGSLIRINKNHINILI